MEEPACKPDPVPGTEVPAAAISLGAQAGLPTAPPRRGSPAPCGLPGSSGGPPSNAACLALLRVGLAEPARSPAPLVRSYRTVSPLPLRGEAVCFLLRLREVTPAWVSPAPCPAESGLSSTARCAAAAARPAPPHPAYAYRSPASHRSTPRFARASAEVFCSRGTCSKVILSKPAARLRARRCSGWRCSLFTR